MYCGGNEINYHFMSFMSMHGPKLKNVFSVNFGLYSCKASPTNDIG